MKPSKLLSLLKTTEVTFPFGDGFVSHLPIISSFNENESSTNKSAAQVNAFMFVILGKMKKLCDSVYADRDKVSRSAQNIRGVYYTTRNPNTGIIADGIFFITHLDLVEQVMMRQDNINLVGIAM